MGFIFEKSFIIRDKATGLHIASLDSTTLLRGTPLSAEKIGPLLAAAPELLEALELAKDVLEFVCDTPHGQGAVYMEAIQKTKAAIKKAKGE